MGDREKPRRSKGRGAGEKKDELNGLPNPCSRTATATTSTTSAATTGGINPLTVIH